MYINSYPQMKQWYSFRLAGFSSLGAFHITTENSGKSTMLLCHEFCRSDVGKNIKKVKT